MKSKKSNESFKRSANNESKDKKNCGIYMKFLFENPEKQYNSS